MQNTDVVLCLQKRQNINSPLQQCSSFSLFSTGSLQGGNLVDPENLDPMLLVGIETEASVMTDTRPDVGLTSCFHSLSPCLANALLPPRLAAALQHLDSPQLLQNKAIKLSCVQRLHLLLRGDSGGIENPQLHPFCLPASAAASLLLSCCTKCSQGRALWILQQPLPTINYCYHHDHGHPAARMCAGGPHTPPKRDTEGNASTGGTELLLPPRAILRLPKEESQQSLSPSSSGPLQLCQLDKAEEFLQSHSHTGTKCNKTRLDCY